jgi:hypothetical protein
VPRDFARVTFGVRQNAFSDVGNQHAPQHRLAGRRAEHVEDDVLQTVRGELVALEAGDAHQREQQHEPAEDERGDDGTDDGARRVARRVEALLTE